MSRIVRVTTDLPIPAERAFALAHRLAVFEHVVRPVIRLGIDRDLRERAARDDAGFTVGERFDGRLWFFAVIPAWRHELKIVADGPVGGGALELYTNERSGPIRVWNHRLTFVPTGESSCRYSDEIELEAPAPLLPGSVLFVKLFFRYRQWRWRRMTARAAGPAGAA